MSVRLSRGFATVPAAPPEPHLELRSAAALTLGIVPFLIHSVTLRIFKTIAYLGAIADRNGHTFLRQAIGILAVPVGTVMMGSAKLFAKAQLLIWKHYVRSPEGDEANTRLAWYGADSLPWQDLQAIVKVFFDAPSSNAWTLEQWSVVEI